MPDPYVLGAVVLIALANLVILATLYRFLAWHGLTAAFVGMVVFATWGTEYALRPISIVLHGEFGREAGVLHFLHDLNPNALAAASLVSLVSTAVFALWLAGSSKDRRAPARARIEQPGEDVVPADSRTRRFSVPLAPLTAIAVIGSGAVALQLGSVGGTLVGQFGRQNIGSGYGYLLVDLAGLSVLIALIGLPLETLRPWSTRLLLVASYLVFLAIHLLVLGGRAEVIIVTIAAFVILTERFDRPKRRVLVAGLIVASVALGMYRVATRDAFTAGPTGSPWFLAVSSLRDPLALVTTYDVSAYDKLILMEEAHLPLGKGSTYIAALLAPVPGSAAGGVEGGNRAYTRLFIPTRYNRGVTFDGISALGEARYNFGWIGPPVVAGLIGRAYGALLRRARRGGGWLLTMALATGIFPSLVRADALNTAALGGSLIVFTLLISALVTRHRERRSPSRPEVLLAASPGLVSYR